VKVKTLEEIAREELGFLTLESRKSDDLDFRSVACWQVLRALELAYAQGYQAREREQKGKASP